MVTVAEHSLSLFRGIKFLFWVVSNFLLLLRGLLALLSLLNVIELVVPGCVQVDCPLHLVVLKDALDSLQQSLGLTEAYYAVHWFVDCFHLFGFLLILVSGLIHAVLFHLLLLNVSLVEPLLVPFSPSLSVRDLVLRLGSLLHKTFQPH